MTQSSSTTVLADAVHSPASSTHLDETHEDDGIVSHSPALRDALDRFDRVVCLDTIVLITGEIGMGKELMACVLYRRS